MHNKCWIVDGRVAIVGGRNIGDAYFGAATEASFSDIDVLLGQGSEDAERIFDSYWNSDATLPVTSLHRIRRGKLAKLRYRLAQHSASYLATRYISHTEQRSKGPWSRSCKIWNGWKRQKLSPIRPRKPRPARLINGLRGAFLN